MNDRLTEPTDPQRVNRMGFFSKLAELFKPETRTASTSRKASFSEFIIFQNIHNALKTPVKKSKKRLISIHGFKYAVVPKGCQIYEEDGVSIYALNEASAKRKFERIRKAKENK